MHPVFRELFLPADADLLTAHERQVLPAASEAMISAAATALHPAGTGEITARGTLSRSGVRAAPRWLRRRPRHCSRSRPPPDRMR